VRTQRALELPHCRLAQDPRAAQRVAPMQHADQDPMVQYTAHRLGVRALRVLPCSSSLSDRIKLRVA